MSLTLSAEAADTKSSGSPKADKFASRLSIEKQSLKPNNPEQQIAECREQFEKKLPLASFSEIAGWKMVAHISLQNEVNSRIAKTGDLVWGLLDEDCRWGSKLIAAKDSLIKGHVVESDLARTLVHSSMSSHRRFKSGGALTIQFDEIIDKNGRSLPIVGKLCRWNNTTYPEKQAPRQIEINAKGQVIKACPTLTDTEKNIFRVAKAATYAPIPGAMAIKWVSAPTLMGVAGAAYPSFVYNKPVDMKERGVRSKAFAYGFLTNLPGAFAVQACVERGEEVKLEAGDELAVNMTFTENSYASNGKVALKNPLISRHGELQ